MQTFIDIIYSLLFISGGYCLIRYRRNVKSWTGNFSWAEQYIGSGGTYIILILLGLFLIFLGVLYPFGGLELLTGPDEANGSIPSLNSIAR